MFAGDLVKYMITDNGKTVVTLDRKSIDKNSVGLIVKVDYKKISDFLDIYYVLWPCAGLVKHMGNRRLKRI